jgi:multiple sugar transport system substrate-binding protein
MRRQTIALIAAALILTPPGARAADLVVWWEKTFYPQGNEAVREIVTAFEQQTGKQVELVRPEGGGVMAQVEAALRAGMPPDFLYSVRLATSAARWAYDDRLVDLGGVLGPVLDLFDADTIEASTLLDGKTGRRGLYALPMGRFSNHVHVWNSLLERAGFTLADIPQGWEAFWAFWCDQVQPAVRKALGRADIWGVGLPMSVAAPIDTPFELTQFQLAYQSSWLSRDGRVQLDEPEVREGIVKAMSAYTEIWRKGCTPPDALDWDGGGNNKAFLAQTIVMTVNPSLSIMAALRTARPGDYYKNATTIDWPNAANGEPLVIDGALIPGVVFKTARDPALARDFVRFLAEGGWLAHWLDFAGDEILPPMRKLVEQPFWLNPSDPHRMRAAIQMLTRTHLLDMNVRDHEWQAGPIWDENVWGNAVHRVAVEGISPEQAVNEAIARIKQILAE